MSFEEVTIGSARLIRADCGEVLTTIDPRCAVVADPPYGIGHVRGRCSTRRVLPNGQVFIRDNKHSRLPVIGDDRPFDPSLLLHFSEILIWGADHYRSRLPPGGRFLAWNKLGDKAPWDSFSDVEFAWHSQPGASRLFSHLWKGICSWRAGEHCPGGRNVRREHPTQKPVMLMRWCVEQMRNAGTIVDPYMGSGTTGVACAQLGRPFIGIEIEARYFDIACERISTAQREMQQSG